MFEVYQEAYVNNNSICIAYQTPYATVLGSHGSASVDTGCARCEAADPRHLLRGAVTRGTT